jgi:methylmalonyl-CoA mutase
VGEANLFPQWSEADWRKAAEAALKGKSLDSLASSTDGIRVEPLYQSADGPRALRSEGPWRIVTRIDHPVAEEANAQALDDIAGGAAGLMVVFSGALGAYGFGLQRVDSASLHAAFERVRFDEGLWFELDLGREGAECAQRFAALIERSGTRPENTAVSFGLDPFAAAAFGPFPRDWALHAKPFVEAALALARAGFSGPLAAADARAVHAAGGSPGQELAFALSAGVAWLRGLEAARIPLDEARRRIAFRLAADADQFVTLSKFRALRLMWARVEEACGLEPQCARVHGETAWRMMTARDPYVNVLRGAIAAFSAGLGGADSVSVLPHTLAVGVPDSLARRLARNGQLILLRESHLGFVADPAAGAGAFEALTKALVENGWARFQRIEAEGGLPAVLASGAFEREVAESAATLKEGVARMRLPITGVSAHPDLGEGTVDVAPAAAPRQSLDIAAGALRPMRLSEPFEALRAESDKLLAQVGARPKAYLVAIGPEPSHRRRVAFMRDWFESGGVEPIYDGEAATPDEAVARLRRTQASLACLCGDDAANPTHAAAFAKAIKATGVKALSFAGRAGDAEASLRAVGVDSFIFSGGDAIAALQDLYRRLAA